MPATRLALILVSVILAAGLTVWIGWALSGAVTGGGAIAPLGLAAVAGLALAVRLLLRRAARHDRPR